MANPYVNQLLFGHSKHTVTPEYVKSLEGNMLTSEWLAKNNADNQAKSVVTDFAIKVATVMPKAIDIPKVAIDLPKATNVIPKATDIPKVAIDLPKAIDKPKVSDVPKVAIDLPKATNVMPKATNVMPKATNVMPKATAVIPKATDMSRPQKQGNSLFWAIYAHENPAEEFLRPSAANVEIETRLKIVASLKQTPKRLKDTNSKMTLESTQALLGSMLTAREDKLEFCIAYSVYFGKHILVVYPTTYQLFSPYTTAEIEDDDHVIILYASKKQKIFYSAEPNPTKQMADTIIRTKLTLLKAQSNYKIPELESVANRLNIATKTAEGKRRKKEDVYNEIRLAIHNDMHFLDGPIR
jgi:hypothetical protein